MYEDAGCSNPCGGEPMMCGNCPELRGSSYDQEPYDPYDDPWADYEQPDPDCCPECGGDLDEMKRHWQCPECGWTCPY